ncbi:MAG TPA: DNA polymerase III subunit gamma/tau [Patescibacteria group bacterium]|nr:DNA polymerase III subunit gamma/tau [Patescibacteria group bacterium]
MSTTLYRKYRPQNFKEVVDQNHVKITLQHEIETGKLAHAFLFSGPRGIGKTTIARILAKSLNCRQRQAKESEPCGQCSSCLEIAESRSLDLVEVDAASNRGINEIRELREQTKYSPAKEKYKVFIIDEAHMLTTEAFNALLKTLEEPPAHAIFVLATTEIHKIPDTIISRCQRFDFRKVPFEAIVKHLAHISDRENVKVDKEVLENVARLSEGYLRDAISLLGQILALGEKNIDKETASLVLPRSDWQEVLKFISLLIDKDGRQAVELVNKLFEEGIDLEHFTAITIESLRKVLYAKITGDWQAVSWEFGAEWLKPLAKQAEKISAGELVKMIEILMIAFLDVKKAQIIQLPLEMAIVKIIEDGEGSDDDQGQNTPLGGGEARSEEGRARKEEGKNKKEEVISKEESVAEASLSAEVTAKAEASEASEEKTILNPQSSIHNHSVKISFEDIKKKWPEVAEALKEHNHSLSTFLKVGNLSGLEGNRIMLSFDYKFHIERIKEKKNFAIISEVLKKVYNCDLLIDGQLAEQSQRTAEESQSSVKSVLDVFGGEVVN